MSNTFKRFAFDREFASDGTVLRDGEKIKRVLTEAEANAMAEEAAAGARQSEEAVAAREAADALKQVSGKLQALVARLDAESEAMRADAARLAIAAARAVAGVALDQYGADTIEQCVKEALADLRAEPRIAIRVAPHLADAIAERIYQYAEAEGFADAVVVRADAEAAAGDCVIEWRSGAVERTAAEIDARIAAAVENWLARPAEDRDAADGADASSGGGAAA
jgi:flagellar assembly protein FliH